MGQQVFKNENFYIDETKSNYIEQLQTMYQKDIVVPEMKYKEFLESEERCNFQQSLEWAEVKKPNWKPEVILAEDEDGNITGSLCVWIRKMPIF